MGSKMVIWWRRKEVSECHIRSVTLVCQLIAQHHYHLVVYATVTDLIYKVADTCRRQIDTYINRNLLTIFINLTIFLSVVLLLFLFIYLDCPLD
jgi:hypothetical protein